MARELIRHNGRGNLHFITSLKDWRTPPQLCENG
jgi:hypothetical protein